MFVAKKDGSLRLCVDYRGLNVMTIKNRHFLSLIDETLDRLVGVRYFTKLDFKNAYYRIRIRAGDEWKTAFRTRYDLFEYTVMLFGLFNALVIFQAKINKALRGLVDYLCVIYLDDILIYFKTKEEHWRVVRQVLERLRKFKLFVNLAKCVFMTQFVEFLKFIISNYGVFMDSRRVKSIRTWPHFISLRELQVFLGFANFYRRFVECYAKITRFLTELLKKSVSGKQSGSFLYGEVARAAFLAFLDAFTQVSMLVHFDLKNKIRVEIDAFGFAIAAILSQLVYRREGGFEAQWHSVAFYFRKMISAKTRYEIHDGEFLAIVTVFQ